MGKNNTSIFSICRNGWIFVPFKLANPSTKEHQIPTESSFMPHHLGKVVGLHCCHFQPYTRSCLQISVYAAHWGWVTLRSFFWHSEVFNTTRRRRASNESDSEEAHVGPYRCSSWRVQVLAVCKQVWPTGDSNTKGLFLTYFEDVTSMHLVFSLCVTVPCQYFLRLFSKRIKFKKKSKLIFLHLKE